MYIKRINFIVVIAIACLFLSVSSIQAMSIQKMTISQEQVQIKQLPITVESKATPSNLFSLNSAVVASGPTTIQWNNTFSGKYGSVYTYSIIKTIDGGYAISGSGVSSNGSTKDIYLVKINTSGGITWSKIYSTSGIMYDVRAIQQTSDNGYIIAGYYIRSGNSLYGGFLLKTDSLGNYLWSRVYDYQGSTLFAMDVKEYSDGGYFVTGTLITNNNGNNVYNTILMKTDSNGIALWGEFFGEGTGGGNILIEQATGNILIYAGGVVTSPIKTNDFYKFDAEGTPLAYVSDTNSQIIGSKFIQTQDGGFALLGKSQDGYALLRLSNSFEQIWLMDCQIQETGWTCNCVEEIPGNGFILSGYLYNGTVVPNWNVALVKISSYGDIEWVQTTWSFNNNSWYIPMYVTYTSDGGYVISGDCYLSGSSQTSRFFILKLK